MDQIQIGQFIAALRKENGLTQQALGEELGVTNKTVSRWETGVYMPDIEMLQLLSKRFQVSINELLCGRRLEGAEFRQAADENLLFVSRASAFSAKEKADFWKRKWLREHLALILLCVFVCVGLPVYAWLRPAPWLAVVSPLLWLGAYAALRNRMIIYIENQLYGPTVDRAK